MIDSLSKEAADWREGRRLRAWELEKEEEEGRSRQRIADAFLGVSKGAVSQGMKRAREGGVGGPKAPTRSRSYAAPERATARPIARASGERERERERERSAGARFSGRGVDVREGGRGDPKRVRGELPSG